MSKIESIELANLESYSRRTRPNPGEIPKLSSFDIYGESIQIGGPMGGDHIIYIDFKKRYDLDGKTEEVLRDERFTEKAKTEIVEKIRALKNKGALLIADVSGHFMTDFSFATRLHDAFLIGVLYEIEGRGDVTANLFRKLNTRLYNSSTFDRFITMIYAEISETGIFKFISAGHPFPILYSRESGTLKVISSSDFKNSPPLAAFPSTGLDTELNDTQVEFSSRFKVNSYLHSKKGDILVLYTDGLSEHKNDRGILYFDPEKGGRLRDVIHRGRDLPIRDLFYRIQADLMKFSVPKDDLSYILIKKNS